MDQWKWSSICQFWLSSHTFFFLFIVIKQHHYCEVKNFRQILSSQPYGLDDCGHWIMIWCALHTHDWQQHKLILWQTPPEDTATLTQIDFVTNISQRFINSNKNWFCDEHLPKTQQQQHKLILWWTSPKTQQQHKLFLWRTFPKDSTTAVKTDFEFAKTNQV